jgi:hypothetical protein
VLWPEAEKRPNTALFGPEKRPPEAIFGGNYRLFWSTTGHFSCAAGDFFWAFWPTPEHFLGALAKVDSAHGNFLAPKQTKKTNESKKIKKSISMHAIAYFNGNKDTSNSVFDIFCTVQVFLPNKTFSMD